MAINIVTHTNEYTHIHIFLSSVYQEGLEAVTPQKLHPLKASGSLENQRVPGLVHMQIMPSQQDMPGSDPAQMHQDEPLILRHQTDPNWTPTGQGPTHFKS